MKDLFPCELTLIKAYTLNIAAIELYMTGTSWALGRVGKLSMRSFSQMPCGIHEDFEH